MSQNKQHLFHNDPSFNVSFFLERFFASMPRGTRTPRFIVPRDAVIKNNVNKPRTGADQASRVRLKPHQRQTRMQAAVLLF